MSKKNESFLNSSEVASDQQQIYSAINHGAAENPARVKPLQPNLRELGFAERRRARRSKPGAVAFDDLGNAQYQWKDESMLEESLEGETRRMRALALANLVLVDDEPPPDLKTITVNQKGLRVGYNPYESGRLEKKERKKKRDLRALSQWIEARKKANNIED